MFLLFSFLISFYFWLFHRWRRRHSPFILSSWVAGLPFFVLLRRQDFFEFSLMLLMKFFLFCSVLFTKLFQLFCLFFRKIEFF